MHNVSPGRWEETGPSRPRSSAFKSRKGKRTKSWWRLKLVLYWGSVGMEGRSLNKLVGAKLGMFLTKCQGVRPVWKVPMASSGQRGEQTHAWMTATLTHAPPYEGSTLVGFNSADFRSLLSLKGRQFQHQALGFSLMTASREPRLSSSPTPTPTPTAQPAVHIKRDCGGVRQRVLALDSPGFETWLYLVSALLSWASDFPLLRPQFVLCKMGLKNNNAFLPGLPCRAPDL